MAVVGLAPDISGSAFCNEGDPIVAQHATVSRKSLVVFECISVKFVQTIPGAEPDKSFFIL